MVVVVVGVSVWGVVLSMMSLLNMGVAKHSGGPGFKGFIAETILTQVAGSTPHTRLPGGPCQPHLDHLQGLLSLPADVGPAWSPT